MILLVTKEGIISQQQQEILQLVKTSRPALSPTNAPIRVSQLLPWR